MFMKAHKDDLLDDYHSQGYDAIVDPEDYIFMYDMPLILINEDKFEQRKDVKELKG